MSRYIDADALIFTRPKDRIPTEGYIEVSDIDRAKTIDPVKHGKWVFENRTGFHQPLLKCSYCGRRQYVARFDFDYCPYCGAKMDGGEDE